MAQVDLYHGSPDTRQVPSREDMADIMQMVGPLFASSTELDSMITQRPGELSVGSHTIKQSLMELERDVRYNNPPPTPHIPQPVHHAPPPYVGNPVPHTQQIQNPPLTHSPFTIVKEPNPQLEFNLDSSQLEITNKLLGDISSKLSRQMDLLTKLVTLLTSEKDGSKVKTKQSRVPKAAPQSRETE